MSSTAKALRHLLHRPPPLHLCMGFRPDHHYLVIYMRGDGGLGETLGGGAEVVADEEGGGGLGSGWHHFSDGFCWRKRWFIEKQ
ncbi:hypothetical protein FCV25MIE_09538 [Fagus crenata]